MLPDRPAYEHLIYTLQQNYPFIQQSTLVVICYGAVFAELTGTVMFDGDVTLTVWEDLNFARRLIQGYGYLFKEKGDYGTATTNPRDPLDRVATTNIRG